MEFNRTLSSHEERLWAAFRACPSDVNRNTLVDLYMPLVDQVMRAFRNVREEDRKDLKGAGYFGLVKAVGDWDPARMVWLDFVRLKIRYAAVDQIRAVSWVPKGVRQRARKLEEGEESLAMALGRDPTVPELAAHLSMDPEECEQQLSAVRGTDWSIASLEGRADIEATWYETLEDPHAPDPEDKSLWAEQVDALELVLQRLPALDRRLIRWKYFEGLAQKEMARRLSVHESRVSQLLDAALAKARRLAEQPFVMFEEVYESDERFTRRD